MCDRGGWVCPGGVLRPEEGHDRSGRGVQHKGKELRQKSGCGHIFQKTRPLGGARGGGDEPRNGSREAGRARPLWASFMAGRMEVEGSEGGDSVHVAGAGWGLRARPAPGWRGLLNPGGDRARWPAECWEHRAGWRASRLHAERPLSPSLGWLVLALPPPPAQRPRGAGRGNATLMMDPHLGRFAKGQE